MMMASATYAGVISYIGMINSIFSMFVDFGYVEQSAGA